MNEQVSKQLKYHNGCLTLTTPGWSSRVAKSYITITAYLIDDNWKLKDYVSCTSELENSYTGDNLANHLFTGAKDWDISLKKLLNHHRKCIKCS